jgi:phosphohistidine phosphatase SixA
VKKAYLKLRRRPLLTPVWIFGLWGMLLLAAGMWVVLGASTTVVIVTRHAEKAPDSGDDPPLSEQGLQRAERLAATFGQRRLGEALDAIFVTQYRRTQQTADPLARATSARVITVQANDLPGLARRLLSEYRGKRVFVVAHGDTVLPLVAELLGDDSLLKEHKGAEVEYGEVYVVAVPRFSRAALLQLHLP